jgi:hypothetical protein
MSVPPIVLMCMLSPALSLILQYISHSIVHLSLYSTSLTLHYISHSTPLQYISHSTVHLSLYSTSLTLTLQYISHSHSHSTVHLLLYSASLPLTLQCISPSHSPSTALPLTLPVHGQHRREWTRYRLECTVRPSTAHRVCTETGVRRDSVQLCWRGERCGGCEEWESGGRCEIGRE